MREAKPRPPIGAEIPYRRSRMARATGSLVFDGHLAQRLKGKPEPEPAFRVRPTQAGPAQR